MSAYEDFERELRKALLEATNNQVIPRCNAVDAIETLVLAYVNDLRTRLDKQAFIIELLENIVPLDVDRAREIADTTPPFAAEEAANGGSDDRA